MTTMLLPGKKGIVGLDIGTNLIKVAKLKESSKGLYLENLGMTPVPPQAIVDGAIMDAGVIVDSIKNLIQEEKIKTKDVCMAVSGHSVIVKKISLPEMPEEELEESIQWEAEQYIPFDIDDVNIDFQILETYGEAKEGKMDVLLVAVKKDKIDDYTRLVKETGLNPVIVDLDTFAIENAYEINYEIEKDRVIALIDIGAGVMNINVLKDGISAFTRDISIGGNQYTEAIQKELNIGYEEAETLKKGGEIEDINYQDVQSIIDSVSENISVEIQRSFDFFKATSQDQNIDKIILSGGCAKIRGIDTFLNKKIGIDLSIANPLKNIQFSEKKFDAAYLQEIAPLSTVCIGLALRKVGDR